MAKRKASSATETGKPVETTDLSVELYDQMEVSYREYGEFTLEERAMPDLRDGLKPVHRRILYAMAELGVQHNKKQTKSARIVGHCYAADTLVTMADAENPHKRIVDVAVGDVVRTRHGNFSVTKIFNNGIKEVMGITAGGRELTLTPEERVWARSKDSEGLGSWVEARNLRHGHQLLTEYGWHDLTATSHYEMPINVYDIEVDVVHEFYANGIVAHNCLGVYHPHGDKACYDAMVNMAGTKGRGASADAPWFTSKTHEPLVWGFGNFGDSASNKQAGAMRYTESKLSKYADEFLLDPEYLAIMPMLPNFDGTTKEPLLLPAKVPNVLVNGSFGIAVALTTNIPTFSLQSVKKASALALAGTLTDKGLVRVLEPSFVGGGYVPEEQYSDLILGQSSSVEIYAEVVLVGNRLVVRETPPGLKIEKILQILGSDAATVRTKDETGPDGIELVAYGKKMSEVEARKWQNRVQAKMKARQKFSINVTQRGLKGVKLRMMTPLEIIQDWATWRIAMEKRVVKGRIEVTEAKKRRTEVLRLGLINFSIFEKALKEDDSEAYLVKHIKGITLEEAKYLLDQPMRRFKKMVQADLENQIKELAVLIKSHQNHLKNPVPEIIKELK